MAIENVVEDVKDEAVAGRDVAESLLHHVDRKVTSASGLSLFHILTGASIVASIILFLRGNKLGAIFVGLWPPTFQALKSASQKK